MFSSLQVLWVQVPPMKLLFYLIFLSTKKILHKSASVSYAQTGEDLLLARCLDTSVPGFYVDVGCNHPVKYSNTYFLYLRGWAGIVIDGNPDLAPAWKNHRPRDKFVHACISDQEKAVSFNVFESNELSSVSGKAVQGLGSSQYKLKRCDVMQTQTLDAVLAAEETLPRIGLLSIDIEGEDFAALRSIDLSRYRPEVIVIEVHGIDVGMIGSHTVSKYLEKYGYLPFACQMSNVMYRLAKQ